MELLAGDADYMVTQVSGLFFFVPACFCLTTLQDTVQKEQGCKFRFDYSEVYWNSCLSTEHARLVALFKPGDVIGTGSLAWTFDGTTGRIWDF